MSKTIGIIRETKNDWERRAPLVPSDVAELLRRAADKNTDSAL